MLQESGATRRTAMNIGAQLRASRESKGLSIETVAHATRVQPRILSAIELNDVAAIPPRPFGRGFVRAYAREIGLDAESIVSAYFAQFASSAPVPVGAATRRDADATPWPLGWIWAVAALAIVLGVTAAAILLTDRPQAPVTEPAAVGTSGAAVAAGAPAAPLAATRPEPSPAPASMTVVVRATRRCWVNATADGERAIYRLMEAGALETLRASREIAMRVGDAGALTWTINGVDRGPVGEDGEVKTVRLTPDSSLAAR
jgi:cytoskeletal protein RodZ